MTTSTQEPTINGINLESLERTIAAIKEDPATGKTGWSVASRWQGGTRTDHRVDGFILGGEEIIRQFQIKIDEPAELCGTNQFANPQEYLLAATNACMMVGYSTVAALMGVELTKMEIETSGEIDLRGFLDIDQTVAPGYEQLRFTVRLSGHGTQAQFQQIHETVQRTSPNFYNISRPINVSSELIVEER